MTRPGELSADAEKVAAVIAERLSEQGRTVAVAESLTSGSIASHLGAAPDAGQWFAGGVVAYASAVKFEVLGVEPGPVITPSCARQMSEGVARLTSSDLGLAVTGVGGPDPEEGHPAGTVFIAVHTPDSTHATAHHFDGDPPTVVQLTALEALRSLLAALDD